MLLATPGVDILSNSNITTPAGFIIAVLIFIANQYFRGRAESRTDGEAERTTESGIVETSRATLAVVREQIEQMQQDARDVRAENRKRTLELSRRIDELEAYIERLEDENRQYRRQLGFAARPEYGQQPATAGYGDEFRGRAGTYSDGPGSGVETGGGGAPSSGRRRADRNEI